MTRSISQLGYDVAPGVEQAIRLLQEHYGASSYRDSGHTQTSPTWIFELPRYGAEVGVRMNKRDLSLYMRNRTLDGSLLSDCLPPEKIAKVYPRDGNPAASIGNSQYLGPSAHNEVLMLTLVPDDLAPLFGYFFAEGCIPSVSASVGKSSPVAVDATPAAKLVIDAETFAALQERKSEIGRTGEFLVAQDELVRLHSLGCPNPEQWVTRVALSDVGRGYDIESTWPDEERCIEVKTTTCPGSDFFLTANEREVLSSLGDKAWLYRVVLADDGTGQVVSRLQNPMAKLAPEAFVPVLWRIASPN